MEVQFLKGDAPENGVTEIGGGTLAVNTEAHSKNKKTKIVTQVELLGHNNKV